MLTEKRQEEIVRLVQERESITVAELKDILQTSESTIRRDITSLDKEGRLTKVFGGAIALRTAQIVNQELSVERRQAGCWNISENPELLILQMLFPMRSASQRKASMSF